MAYSTWNNLPSGEKVFTPLSYSDRVRNMVRAGESGSGYSGILRANTSPPATNSPTPPHYQGHSPSCACARHSFSPPSRTCLLLVDRSSRRGDWANELTRRASGGPGWAGQRSLFRFKSLVVARGARNWRCVVIVHFFRVVVNLSQDCQLGNFMASQTVWTLVWWAPIRERLSQDVLAFHPPGCWLYTQLFRLRRRLPPGAVTASRTELGK